MARPYTILDCEQGSPEWAALRLGRITSSAADCVISLAELFDRKGRDNEKTRQGYALRLAKERVTGLVSDESFTTGAMERGTALEPRAFLRYIEAHPDDDVRKVGFVAGDSGTWGDSPDALIYDRLGQPVGSGEFKCPLAATHGEWINEWLETRTIPTDHVRQCLHHLWAVPSLAYVDFASYHPDLPGEWSWLEVRLERSAAQNLLDRYDAAIVRLEELIGEWAQRFREGVLR